MTESQDGFRIGVDIGGTFTDVIGRRGDRVWAAKVPSSPENLVAGVLAGVEAVLALSGEAPGDIERFVHGTTIATNAILEEKGARIGLLMTEGFEDVLEIGRQKRSRMYDLFMSPETPVFLAPGRRRAGISERIDSDGSIVVPLHEAGVRATVARLVEEEEIEAVAVCYLFSFRNPAHERRAADIIARDFPRLAVSISSEVDPVFREYERTCVTAFDAYVRPIVNGYLNGLGAALHRRGIRAPLLIMQSRGGVASARRTVARPVTTLLSGPAAGALGGRSAGERSGRRELITLDIGGTSTDVALARGGASLISREGRIRGYPLRVPMVDVHTIGAGGGSIARLDDAGVLKVGPESAGANPGPACYGRGGSVPTVTDASLVLGYLDPARFAGGIRLRTDAAERAVGALAEAMQCSLAEAAFGIHTVCNAAMAEAVRMLTVKRGHDPRDFALVLLGGAGPLHGGAIAERLAIETLIVPPRPGVLAAEGLLEARIQCDRYRTFATRAQIADPASMDAAFEELEAAGRAEMSRDGVAADTIAVERFAEMRYVGQSYELEVPLGRGAVESRSIAAAERAFRDRYREVYGHGSLEEVVEFVNLRVLLSGPPMTPPVFARVPADRPAPAAFPPAAVRPAFFGRPHGWRDTALHDRAALAVGAEIEGPAIVTQADTTTVVYPGHRATVDDAGNLVVARGRWTPGSRDRQS